MSVYTIGGSEVAADAHEAVRLMHATLAFVSEHPAMVAQAPIAVLATVLGLPPWSLDWQDAVTLVSESLPLTAETFRPRLPA